MKKYIFLLSFCMGVSYFSNSQILKKIGNKVINKPAKKEEPKPENSNEPSSEDPNKNSKASEEKKDTTNVSGEKAEYKTAYKSKFDFVPGEKVIIWDDFKEDAIGDFPAKWYTNGSGEIVSIADQEGKWLMTKASSEYFIDQLLNLPENFTIQFDLMCSVPFNWSSGVIEFKLMDIQDIDRFRKGQNGGEMSNNNFNHPIFSFNLHPGLINKGTYNSKGYGRYKFGTLGDNIDLKETFMPLAGKIYHENFHMASKATHQDLFE